MELFKVKKTGHDRIFLMKQLTVTVFLIFLLGVTSYGQAAKHVILISIDGFCPDFYKDKSWSAPNLHKLMAEGVYASGVNSVFPSVTYPSHTTLITGAMPARHGIYYNAPYGAKNGQWYWEESYIKTGTIWDAIKEKGLKSGAVMWPVTVGAPIDYNFPVRRADNDENSDQLSVTIPFITPANLIQQMESATGKLNKSDFNTNNTIDQTIGKMANYMISTYKPNFMAMHFVTIDHLQHEYGRDAAQVKKAVAMVDSIIGSVVKTVEMAGLKGSTAILVTGDHGFVDTKVSLSPNTWLAQNKLLSKTDWTAKFLSSGGSAFLYLKNRNDMKTLSKVKEIIAGLPADQKKLFRLVDRKELDKIGANPEVALALSMAIGVAANNDFSGETVKPKKNGGTHGYFPDFYEIRTGFIAAGAGINKGAEIKEMGIQDIAPIISELLGLKFKSPDGLLIPRILKNKP